jgi:translation elongation factor EF-Tu-like GTPase
MMNKTSLNIAESKPVMRQPDFEAEIRFLSQEDGGREKLPLQGYRSDLRYKDQNEETAWMIWPLFLNEEGIEIPRGHPVKQQTKANMYIVSDDLRKTVHRQKIREGIRFHLVEGKKIVADGAVTQVLGLWAND